MEATHYDVLGVDPWASKADVKAAYVLALEEARTDHDPEREAEVRRAWQVLSDPVQRQRYDEEIELPRRANAPAVVADEVDDDDVDVDLDFDGDDVDPLLPGEPLLGRRLPVGAPAFLEQPTIGRRVVASLIDVITLLAVYFPSVMLTILISGVDSSSVSAVPFWSAWAVVLVAAMFVYPTWRAGQTLGKRFTYLMTVNRVTGELLTPWQVIRRYIIQILLLASLPLTSTLGPMLALFLGLSYAMARDQLSLADRFGQSIVVIARYRPPRPGDTD